MKTQPRDHAATPATPAKHGQGLRTQIDARQRELTAELNEGNLAPSLRIDIETALAGLDALLTGDLDQISPVVAAELNVWLEAHKYLGAKAGAPVRAS